VSHCEASPELQNERVSARGSKCETLKPCFRGHAFMAIT